MAITVQEAQVVFSADGLSQVKTKAGEAGKALDRTTTSAAALVTRLKSVRFSLGGLGSLLAGIGAGTAATKMMSLAAGAEQTAIAFEVLLGSASDAKQMIESMRELDMKTVFGMRELSDAAKMLLNFGVAGSEVVPILARITDIAAGDAQKLEGMARAFGQMASAGRLMGQDLNQMINAGFNPLQEISKRTGESMMVLKARMEAGLISVAEVKQAFVDATSAGGRFANMNDRMSKTTGGQFLKLRSEIELLAIAIGTELLPEANKLIESARSLFDRTDNIKSAFGAMKDAVKNWFTETQEKFEGVGIVIGVTATHMADVFKTAFNDIQSVAAAAFKWITDNATAMVDNLGIRIERMKLLMGLEAGPEAMQPLREFAQFEMPDVKSGDAGMTLSEKIRAEIEVARKIKEEEAAKKAQPQAQGPDLSVLQNELQRSPRLAARREQVRFGESRTFSAEALFASLRDTALNKQINLASKTLDVQQQQLIAQQQMANGINNINLGLA